MMRSQVSVSLLPRSLTVLETWGFGFSGLLLWLGIAPVIHFALGANAIWVWLPAALIGMLLNLQVQQLGNHFPDVAGGTPNYTTRLLQQFPGLARYSAIGYLLGWVSVPPVNAIILTDLIQENLDPMGLTSPVLLFRIGFVVLPFVVALGGTRTLGILQAFFVFPAIGLLTTFCLQGIGWLSVAPDSPGLMSDTWTSISANDWLKWFFISTYAAYSCETASSFVSESRQPAVTLRCLRVTAGFIPIVYLAGSWVLTRLAPIPGAGNSTYFSLVTAASTFWGTLAPALVTFLMTSGCLLSSTTAVSNGPRILYQLAIDGYLPPVFSVISRRGVPTPSLVFVLCLSLLCLAVGNVAQIVMITGTGWLLAIMATHFGLWLKRQQPETRWPWLSLGFLIMEGAVLVIGGSFWGWPALGIGVLLPFAISSISTFLPHLGFAPLHPDWWQHRNWEPTDRLKADWIIAQVVVLIGLICGAVSISWFIRAKLDNYGPENQLALFSVLLITIAFVGVAIACWTSLSQVAIIAEAQKTVEQTLNELQQQTQQVQALNRVTQSIRNSLDLPTIFATATAEVTQLLNVHRTTIVQYMPDRACWHVVACFRLNESFPDVTGLELPDEGNLFAARIKQFEVVQVDGLEEIDDPVNQEIARQFPGIIWLIIPIVLNNRIWGALSVSKPKDEAPWKDTAVELASKIADQVAISIQQAQLYQQAQQELRQRQQAEASLQQLNQELEQRVQERTQQFQQEATLRQQAEIQFQTTFHVSPHAIAIASLSDRRIIEINEAFCNLFGYTRDEMVDHSVDEFTLFANPADQGMVQHHLMKNGTVRNLECIYRTRTGEVRTGIASAEFIHVDGIPCFMVVANDITERKRAEAALAQSEARFQKIAAASPAQIYILVTDIKGFLIRFEYVSPSVWELRELSSEQLLHDPSPVYDQIHPDDRTGYFAARNHSLSTMEPFFHEYRIVPPSGQLRWVRVNARPEQRENNEIYWYGIILDVSDRKQAEEALRQSEERWQLAIRGSNEAIWDWNIKTDVAFRSDRFYEILGCLNQDLRSEEQTWVSLIHPEDVEQVLKAKQAYLAQKIPTFAVEYRIRCQDNTYKWVLDRAIAVWDEQGNPVRMVGSMGDISDRKQIEQQLRTSLKEKEVLLREVYHRVKNNMQLVSSLLSLQASTIADPALLRLLNESQQRVKTMALIHERLYRSENLARINTATYIRDLVNNLILSYKTTGSSIQLNLDVAELELDLDVAVPCSLIINELISNALKYAFPNKQGTIKLKLGLDSTNHYCLVVQDNGIGIPADIDLQNTETLGMQLIYGLTEQLGGAIELDRQEGSQFKVTFRSRH